MLAQPFIVVGNGTFSKRDVLGTRSEWPERLVPGWYPTYLDLETDDPLRHVT